MELNEAELNILFSALSILKQSCESVNHIYTREDKIDTEPVTKLIEKIDQHAREMIIHKMIFGEETE